MPIKKPPPKKKSTRKKATVTRLPVKKKPTVRKKKPGDDYSQIVRELIQFAEVHKVPEGHMVGQNLQLMDWQKQWFVDTFHPDIRVSLLSVARRAGKTVVVAIVMSAALYGPLVVPNSLLISASRSRDQAAIVYKYIFNMARLSGFGHMLKFRESKKEIYCPQYGTTYMAVSADAARQHGKSGRVIVYDEIGQVRGPTDELYDTLSSGQGSYTDAKSLIISTRAPNDNDLFNILIDDAQSGLDPSTAVTVYSADEDCDLLDEKQWLKANPSLTSGVRDLADLRRQAEQASRMPSKEASFRNLILNQKVDPNASFISASIWKQGNREINEELFLDPNNFVYGGLDLSARTDITAFVLAVEDPESGDVHVKTYSWTPAEGLIEKARTDRVPLDVWVKQGFLTAIPGNAIHYEHLAHHIAEIVNKYEVIEVAFDRWHIDQLEYEFDKIGAVINLTPCGQGFRDISPRLDELESLLFDERLVHGGNPLLTNHMSNVMITMDPTNARKVNKKLSTSKVDAVIALIMAVGALKRTGGDENSGGLYGSDEGAAAALI